MTTATATTATALTYLQEMSSVYEAGFVDFFFKNRFFFPPPSIQPTWPCSAWFAGGKLKVVALVKVRWKHICLKKTMFPFCRLEASRSSNKHKAIFSPFELKCASGKAQGTALQAARQSQARCWAKSSLARNGAKGLIPAAQSSMNPTGSILPCHEDPTPWPTLTEKLWGSALILNIVN